MTIATDTIDLVDAISLFGDAVTDRITAGGTIAGDMDIQGLLRPKALQEKRVALAGNAIDLTQGNVFTKTVTGSLTFSVTNVPDAGLAASFLLDLTNGGNYSVTWWAGLEWGSGTPPTLTVSGRDVLAFLSHDGGTTWTGVVVEKDVK